MNYHSQIHETLLDHDFFCVHIHNQSGQTDTIEKTMATPLVQFYFCLKGHATWHTRAHEERFNILESHGLILYHDHGLPIRISVSDQTTLLIIVIDAKKLHRLFMLNNPDSIWPINQALWHESWKINPHIKYEVLRLEQHIAGQFHNLFIRGGIYQLLSLTFAHIFNQPIEKSCPFPHHQYSNDWLMNINDYAEKNMEFDITKLATALKGSEPLFRKMIEHQYGSTQKWQHHIKMMHAKKRLDQTQLPIKIISKSLGYAHPSHFIQKFKNQYGFTPKQYLIHHHKNKIDANLGI